MLNSTGIMLATKSKPAAQLNARRFFGSDISCFNKPPKTAQARAPGKVRSKNTATKPMVTPNEEPIGIKEAIKLGITTKEFAVGFDGLIAGTNYRVGQK